jgi:hypothetical protein
LSATTTLVGAQSDDALDFPILVSDDPVDALFEEGVYAHMWAFWGAEGDLVTIQMNRAEDSMVDPYLILFGSSGEILAVDDDGGSVVRDALISEVELPADDMYLVLASSADYVLLNSNMRAQTSTGPMGYTLILEGATEPDNDVQLELNATEMDPGDTATLEISQEFPVAFVTFLADEGDLVTITTTPAGSEVDTMLYLFSTDGTAIGFDDDGATAPYSQLTDVEIPVTGLQLVLATSYQFYSAPEGDWENTGEFNLSIAP